MTDAVKTSIPDKPDYRELYSKLDDIVENSFRIANQPSWIVLCGYAIGETCLFCSLANEFVKTHGHGIVVVVTQKHASVARMYAHRFLKIVIITDDLMRFMLQYEYIPQDRFELDKPINGCWIGLGFRHSDGIKYLGRYPGRGGIGEIDMMRFCLRLPWNARLEPPRIVPEWEDEAWQLAKSAGIQVGRSVLLCPINNSQKTLPNIFWKTVASRLTSNGYKVFTNMGGLNTVNGPPTMPVEATMPVNLPIHLVMPFLNFAGRGISGTNGMFLFIMIAGYESLKMTNLVAIMAKEELLHSSLGFRGPSCRQTQIIATSMQYSAPELCLRTPVDEYIIPNETSAEEYNHLAMVVADQNTEDPSCLKRYETNGKLFTEEHKHDQWLKNLKWTTG
jgi:hypothetical protein